MVSSARVVSAGVVLGYKRTFIVGSSWNGTFRDFFYPTGLAVKGRRCGE